MFDPAPIEFSGFPVTSTCEIQTRKERILERIENPLASEHRKDFSNQSLGKYFSDKESHNFVMEVSPFSCISLGMN